MNTIAKTVEATGWGAGAGSRVAVTMAGVERSAEELTCVLRLEFEGGLLRKAGWYEPMEADICWGGGNECGGLGLAGQSRSEGVEGDDAFAGGHLITRPQ